MKKTIVLFPIAAFAAVFLIPAIAHAGGLPGAVDDWLEKAVVTVTGGAIVAAATWLWNKAGAQRLMKVLNKHQVLEALAEQAIDLAEEQARRLWKAVNKKIEGHEKKSIAVGHLMNLVRKHKLGKMAKEELEDLIEAVLGANRKALVTTTVDITTEGG
jgi:hypothetical protein